MKNSHKARYENLILQNQHLRLLPEKAILWEEKNHLILTDPHLGKAGHFRKAGIPIPAGVHAADLDCLSRLLLCHKPDKVLILGDLFHSEINAEWQDFRRLLQDFAGLPFVLVRGNHDILPQAAYEETNLEVVPGSLEIAPFHFSHHPQESAHPQGFYCLAGHVHPGYRVPLGGGQHIKLPCFFFGKHAGLLPAFGKFTGCVHLPARQRDQVFAVLHPGQEAARVMRVK
jgi:DNA ligase-associated metallophosphoesterase